MLPALRKNPIWAPSVKTAWHSRVITVLKHLVTEVINDGNVLPLIYRRMSLSKLMLCLARTKHNLLIIGTSNSWLVTARTAHPRNFIGTRHAIGLTKRALGEHYWTRIKALALRYSNPGARVTVYSIHPETQSGMRLAELTKAENALV